MRDFLLNISKVHFIGIGGVSMSSLAKYTLCKNIEVSGSDICDSESVKELKGLGAKISIPESNLEKIKPDMIVYSSAISEDNIEILKAKELKIPLLKRSEFLGRIINDFRNSICVCGCHGKTTVTAMLSHIFMRCETVPTCFIGGVDLQFKNFFYGENDTVIAEACEYKKNFLDLSPKTVVCTNVDFDHVDSYNDIKDTINTFVKFTENKQTVINADDKYSLALLKKCAISYGIKKGNIRATKIIPTLYGNSFSVLFNGKDLGRIEINQKGIFNIYNALSAIACAILYRIDFNLIKDALAEFMGVKRRMEYLGTVNNLLYFSDYAHHPKEISETITTFCNKKTVVVFQPHTYSRTKILMEDFIKCLSVPKKVIIYKTYPAREEFNQEGDAFILYKKLKKQRKNVYYCDNEEKLQTFIKKKKRKFDKVLFLGAGNIYDTAKKIVKKENKTISI